MSQCLDDMNGTTTNRNPVQQWTCNGSSSMVWGLYDVNNPLGDQIVNERAAICLDVSDGSLQDGARLQIYNCFDAQGNIAQHYAMRRARDQMVVRLTSVSSVTRWPGTS